MAGFGAFGDDSGSHEQSPIMILAAVVAEYEAWKTFSDDWWEALTKTGKPIKPFNGEIYFKSSDAETLKKCFEGFTRKEADAKVDLLTEIAIEHMLFGMLSAIKWEHFTKILQAGVPKTPKGRLHNYFKHPYYLCFHDLVSSVLSEQAHRKLGEIDFTFDKQGKMLTRSIETYEGNKPNFHPRLREIAGQIIPGDDKILLPLQAADLVAWQSRNRSWPHKGRITSSNKKLVASKKIHYHAISLGELRQFVQWMNLSPATRELIRRFGGIPVQTMRRIEPKSKN